MTDAAKPDLRLSPKDEEEEAADEVEVFILERLNVKVSTCFKVKSTFSVRIKLPIQLVLGQALNVEAAKKSQLLNYFFLIKFSSCRRLSKRLHPATNSLIISESQSNDASGTKIPIISLSLCSWHTLRAQETNYLPKALVE